MEGMVVGSDRRGTSSALRRGWGGMEGKKNGSRKDATSNSP